MTTSTSRRALLAKLPTVTAGTLLAASGTACSVLPGERTNATPRWSMVIDLRRCFGCQACTVACMHENRVPQGKYRTKVTQTSVVDESGAATMVQLPQLCNHCDEPVCITRCPADATFKLEEGNVVIDSTKCIGCGMCVVLCPYKARFINPETKKADKCTFCINRVVAGLLPACVETCSGGARIFGDLNDPQSLLNRTLRDAEATKTPVRVLMPEKGTKPNVFYIGLDDLKSNAADARLAY